MNTTPLGQPGPLGFHAGVGLLAADNAAQMLLRQIVFRQIDKLITHCLSPLFVYQIYDSVVMFCSHQLQRQFRP